MQIKRTGTKKYIEDNRAITSSLLCDENYMNEIKDDDGNACENERLNSEAYSTTTSIMNGEKLK